ncbi:MAG: gas vesicle protein K [Bacteroidales bacterium]|nr:gas vesicle protein K [Bacteroidales bacterium]MCF8338287.1 gas vesicle protein K [Bacteroidales bacterium]
MKDNKILSDSELQENDLADLRNQKSSEKSRQDLNPENAEAGLTQLVMSVVELLRRLTEKQAMQRIDGGSLTEDEIEKLGETLMKLENKMEELKEHFNLTDEDLNLDLGPLGDLM